MLPIVKFESKPMITFFDGLFNDLLTSPSFQTPSIVTPIHDVIENDSEYVVNFYLAGVKKDDISISVERDMLTIKAERREEKDLKYNRKESFTGTFEKSFKLPDTVDKESIDASMEDGVLKLRIPKISDEQKLGVRKIDIK